MRSKVFNLAVGLGLAWSGGSALARPASPPSDDLFPTAYGIGASAALAPSPPSPPTPEPVAQEPSRAPTPAAPSGSPAPRPRMAPPTNAPVGRPRLESFPRSAPVVPPPPRRTVAGVLSTGSARPGGVPDYVPPESRGTLARLVHRAEPEVPPGLPRGATRREMVPPEPLVATRRPGSAVDPLLAPPVAPVESAPAEPPRGELTARYAVDPLLAPRGLPPARERTATLLSQVPPRSEDPLLARKPLVLDRSPLTPEMATAAVTTPPAQVGRDPFAPVIPRLEDDGSPPRVVAEAPAERLPEPPRLIARPRPPGGDAPLRRAGTTPDDL